MGLLDFLKGLFGGEAEPPGRYGLDELARRLDMPAEELKAFKPEYQVFRMPKRTGGTREIMAPNPATKMLQKRILRRLLGRLKCHPAVMGFERGRSVVDNARPHVGKAVVLRMDLKDFFPATGAKRVRTFFRKIGWDREAADVLVRLCTHGGGLPAGAPTSPRLSNLVNHRMDARLAGLASKLDAAYTRYADDMTFSFKIDDRKAIHAVIGMTKHIVGELGYKLHQDRKLQIRRRHERQLVTGLVVNERPALPRKIRRWLRAVEHNAASGWSTTLSPEQLAGWQSLREMVARKTS
ncbi:MAG: reverse transcriptase family protein [Planctomycetota bacterium]